MPMQPSSLADPRAQAFLADKDVAVLATVEPDGAPLAVAMWFVHDDRCLSMVSPTQLRKIDNLQRDPRVCVVVESGPASETRAIMLHGEVTFVADPTEQVAHRRATGGPLLASRRTTLGWSGAAVGPGALQSLPEAREAVELLRPA